MNVDSEYTPYLKRFSKYYGININIPNSEKIIGTVLGTNFYNLILDHKNHNEIYEYLDKNRDEEIFSNLLSILNKYIEYDLYEVRDLIYDELESTSVPSKKYKNVAVVSGNSYALTYKKLVGKNKSFKKKDTVSVKFRTRLKYKDEYIYSGYSKVYKYKFK